MRPSNEEAYARLIVLKGVVVHAMTTPRPMLSDLYPKWSDKERNDFEQSAREQAETIIKDLKEMGAWNYVSPREAKFLQSYAINMDETEHLNAIWRKESINVIMWALGLRETWPNIDQEASPEMLESIPSQKIGLFTQHPNLRPQKEIESKRALLELWHWRVRTRQLIEEGLPFPSDENMNKAGFYSYDDIVRFTAKALYKEGTLPEIIEEDFPFKGEPFRSLSTDDYQLATSIIIERHYAMSWLCGMAPGNQWDETPTPT